MEIRYWWEHWLTRCSQYRSERVLKTCILLLQVSSSEFGNLHSVELVPNGENILVTNSNRQQFVSLYVDHLLVKSVERQFRAFFRGFHKVGTMDGHFSDFFQINLHVSHSNSLSISMWFSFYDTN